MSFVFIIDDGDQNRTVDPMIVAKISERSNILFVVCSPSVETGEPGKEVSYAEQCER